MEPYYEKAYTTSKTTTTTKRGASCCSVFRPLVELGTAPIEVEHIEDLQKIRPFRPSTNDTININSPINSTTSSTAAVLANNNNYNNNKNYNKTTFGVINTKKTTTTTTTGAAAAAAAAVTTMTTTKKKESCLIESTSNSVRVSFLFKAQAKTAHDPLESSILFQWMRLLQQQAEDHYRLLRRKPLEGYSVTFLITNKHLAVHGRCEIEQTILDFCSRIDKECSDIKLQVNAQARYITTEFCKAFNQTTATAVE